MHVGGALGVDLRLADAADAADVAAVHLAAALTGYAGIFPPGAPEPSHDTLCESWRKALTATDARTYVAVDGSTPVGVVNVRADPDFAGCGQLRRLYVLPARWGQGIGSALHDQALGALAELGFSTAGLWVLEANQRAREIYVRRGWSLGPERKVNRSAPTVAELRYRRTLTHLGADLPIK